MAPLWQRDRAVGHTVDVGLSESIAAPDEQLGLDDSAVAALRVDGVI